MASRSTFPYREKPPPALPPCPWCRGTVVVVLIRQTLEVYCSECHWNPDSDEVPDPDR